MANFWQKQKNNIVLFLLIAVAASVPLMTDYVVTGTNLQASLSRIEAIKEGFGSAFPVRVMPLPSTDFGYEAACFQADLFLLIPALLRAMGLGAGTAYKLFLFLINFATAVVSYICFSRMFGGRKTATGQIEDQKIKADRSRNRSIGWLGCVLYTWCPYRLSDMYINANIGETVAWIFLPIVLLGLTQLYRGKMSGEADCSWIVLSLGYSLTVLSSVTFFFVVTGAAVSVLLFMGKRTLKKEVVVNVGRTIITTILVNAWFLIPMLSQMTHVTYVGALVYEDFKSRGMYLLQYLSVFPRAGESLNVLQNGVGGAQVMGVGIGAILLVVGYLYCLFIKKFKDRTGVKVFFATLVLMILSSNLFPWDLMQNKNMFFSMLLAFIQSPAKWGVAACCGLIWLACRFVWKLAEEEEGEQTQGKSENLCKSIVTVAAACAFASIQFLMGSILHQRGFIRPNEEGAWEAIFMGIYTQEPVLWRITEAVSAVTVCAGAVFWIWKKHGEEIGK